jgi:hypothetical protein
MNLAQAQLLYQLTPIWLQNGIATNSAGGYLPILAILNYEVFAALNNLAGQSQAVQNAMQSDWSFENAFAIFQPAPGGSLVKQSIAEYPFANLNVAANATLRDPLNVSMIMMTPMKEPHAWALKASRMTSLKAVLDEHNNLGGTYIVFTPAYIYSDMCIEALTDASTAASPLPQNTWRWDFTKPLVSMQDIYGAESNLISKLTAGLPTNGVITSTLTALGITSSIGNAAFGAGGTVPTLSGGPMVAQ